MDLTRLVGVALATALMFTCAGRAAPGARAAAAAMPQAAPPVPPADHHVNVWSPTAVDAIRQIQDSLGQQVIPSARLTKLGGDEVAAALDSAGIRRGVLISAAYFFGSPEYAGPDEYRKVRAENDYLARQVEGRPHRFVGFMSVNPLADYALEEMDRLADEPGITGLHLHLANSDVDLRDPADVRRLREVFRHADELGMPVLVHLATRGGDYGRRDVETFIDEVLPAAPDVPVQVAHLGGAGAFGPATAEAVDAFVAAFGEHPDRMDRVFFDMASTAAPAYRARGDSALLERVHAIAGAFTDAVGRLGPDRIVYGTDWPVLSIPRNLEGLRRTLPVDREAFRDLIDDSAPYLPGAGGG